MKLREKILAMEKALLTPEVRSSANRVKGLLSEDFIEVGASGACFGLEDVLQSITHQDSWSAHPDDWHFRALSEGVVQVMYRVKIVRGETGIATWSRRTSIWRLEAEGWKMVYHQGTMVAPY